MNTDYTTEGPFGERRREEIREIVVATLADLARGDVVRTADWPPPVHRFATWNELGQVEREQLTVFVDAGQGAVLEVPHLARRARGLDAPNRHDYAAARKLDHLGLTAKVGRTGRRLVAVPLGMPLPA